MFYYSGFEFQDIILSMASAGAPVMRKKSKKHGREYEPWSIDGSKVQSDGKIANINKNSAEPLNV